MRFSKPLTEADLKYKKEIEYNIRRVKKLKQQKKYTYKKIAQIIGVNESTFRGWLTYRQHTIKEEAYKKLIEFLDVEQENEL